jgi:hypothetical protein
MIGSDPNKPTETDKAKEASYQPKFLNDKDDSLDRLLSDKLEAKRRQKQREYERLARKSFILSKSEKSKDPTEEDMVI